MASGPPVAAGLGLLLGLVPGALPQEPKKADEAKTPPKTGPSDPDLLKRTDAAVDRALKWLLKQQEPDGRWTATLEGATGGPFPHGPTALALYAALRTGASPHNEKLVKGFKFLRDRWDAWQTAGRPLHAATSWRTCEAALAIMAIESRLLWRSPLHDPRAKEQVAKRLETAQANCPWARQLRDFLLESVAVTRHRAPAEAGAGAPLKLREAWSYPSPAEGAADRCNTVFAAFGLIAASRLRRLAEKVEGANPTDLGAPVGLWVDVVRNLLDLQEEEGPLVRRVELGRKRWEWTPIEFADSNPARGWAYSSTKVPDGKEAETRPTGTMTAAALATLEIAWWVGIEWSLMPANSRWSTEGDIAAAKAAKSDLKDRYERSVRDARAWLGHHWAVERNPGADRWPNFWLWMIERAGVLSDVPNFGMHDWYREGAEFLLPRQRDDGSWESNAGEERVLATCYGILFLKLQLVPVSRGKFGRSG